MGVLDVLDDPGYEARVNEWFAAAKSPSNLEGAKARLEEICARYARGQYIQDQAVADMAYMFYRVHQVGDQWRLEVLRKGEWCYAGEWPQKHKALSSMREYARTAVRQETRGTPWDPRS